MSNGAQSQQPASKPVSVTVVEEPAPLTARGNRMMQDRLNREARQRQRAANINRRLAGWKLRFALTGAPLVMITFITVVWVVSWAARVWGIWSMLLGVLLLMSALGQLIALYGVARDVYNDLKAPKKKDADVPPAFWYLLFEFGGGLMLVVWTWTVRNNVTAGLYSYLMAYAKFMLAAGVAILLGICIKAMQASRRRGTNGWIGVVALILAAITIAGAGFALGSRPSHPDAFQRTASVTLQPTSSQPADTQAPPATAKSVHSPNFTARYAHQCGDTPWVIWLTNSTEQPHAYMVRQGVKDGDDQILAAGASIMIRISRGEGTTTAVAIKDRDAKKPLFVEERRNC